MTSSEVVKDNGLDRSPIRSWLAGGGGRNPRALSLIPFNSQHHSSGRFKSGEIEGASGKALSAVGSLVVAVNPCLLAA